MERIEKVAYELGLPMELAMVFLVLHMSMLRKCLGDQNSIGLLKYVFIEEDLTYEEVRDEFLTNKRRS